MKMKGSRIFVECLKKENVDTIFSYTGGAVIPIFDDLYNYGREIESIQPRHEQGGTHAADAYARSTGKVGVVLVTSGPGATNTITGIATAYMDSVPMVIVAGQVATGKIGTDAFQEADLTGITLPLTKANFLVKQVEDLTTVMKKAFYIASSGRPGPVVVDIPVDVQMKESVFMYPDSLAMKSYNPKTEGHPKQIKSAVRLIIQAKKPLVLVGGGVIFSGCAPLLNCFLDKFNIPVVTTLMGHGINPANDDLYYGGIGMHGALYGNYAIQNTDLIIALGVRFSDRIIGDPNTFARNAKIIQVDIDPAEIGKNVDVDVPIVGSVASLLNTMMDADIPNQYTQWLNQLKEYKHKHPLQYSQDGNLKAQFLVETLNRFFPEDTIVAVDVGQNQMWVAQYFRFRQGRTLLSSSGLGTMGYSLPAAIGAKIGNPKREVLMISGDGGFQMNIQELATIKKYNLNLKMLVLDNSYLGMVRQWQQLLCKKRYAGTDMEDNPDFTKIARAYGIKARTVSGKEEVEDAVKELVNSTESMLLHAKIDREENVLPMVPAGKSLDQVITEMM
jgi:acetolactate synthase I/II/III large subunit